MRKLILGILSTLVIILISLWLITSLGIVGWTIPSIKDVAIESNLADRNKIADDLMREYLSSYKFILVPNYLKLKDYKINKIDNVIIEDNQLKFTVSYSVKPASNNSGWIAGNGILEDDGWITNKFGFVYGVKNKETYTLSSIGTGP